MLVDHEHKDLKVVFKLNRWHEKKPIWNVINENVAYVFHID